MYACPKCGSKNLEVDVVICRALIQDEDGNIQTDASRCSEEEWNDDSFMQCADCDCHGTALCFFKENDE